MLNVYYIAVVVVWITDVDECAARTHQCLEICVNVPGGYNCSCREGYALNSDGYSCSGNLH